VDETRIFHQLFKSDNPLSATPDFKADINPISLEVIRGAMVEVGFWALAKRLLAEARRESQIRTQEALKNNPHDPHDDTPHATTEQLVGKECMRFQGLRVAYFALDKDARVACLDEAEGIAPVRGQGDFLVLNRIVSLKEDSGKVA
jgi:glutaminyl-tRNA synthetase